MIEDKVHHVYNSKNQVLAHNLTTEELEEVVKPIEEKYEVVTLDVENYREASY
jgi:hypothetical protein